MSSGPNYISCSCLHCDGKIEFDSTQLEAGETRTVACPHCGLETKLLLPEQKPPRIISETVQRLQHLAEQGDVAAQCNLGDAYFYGRGAPQDYSEAAKWLTRAAMNGNAGAQQGLGCCYYAGLGVEQDYAAAVKWFQKAAEQWNAQAQYNLGVCYDKGEGVAKDPIQAVQWWLQAAAQRYAEAQYALGVYYHKGESVAKDPAQAAKWWHQAAWQGNASAQCALAEAYDRGQNVEEAYYWARLAAAQRHQGAQGLCEALVPKMTKEQVAAMEKVVALGPYVSACTTLLLDPQITPRSFRALIGQERLKMRVPVAVAAAKQRGEAMPHILLVGPHGSGKATLACIIAKAMGANIRRTTGPAVAKAGDLAGLLTNLEEGDVLFIEEIHRLQKDIEEYLCPAMRDFKLDIMVDQGPNARSVRLNLPRFTVVGAAPRRERVVRSLLSCFPIVETMDAYTSTELAAIARRFASLLRFQIEDAAADPIARSSDGTPLDILNRLRHVQDYGHAKACLGGITADIAVEALKLLPTAEHADESQTGRQSIPSEVRREVWRRDGGKCVRCGSRESLEYDHIIPLSKGGGNTARNIELLCESCNRSKHSSIQ